MKLKLKKTFTKTKCRIQSCARAPRARGICEMHSAALRAEGIYEKLASTDRMKIKYKKKKGYEGKKCIIDGCNLLSHCRGICTTHYNQLKRRGLYEKFANK